jgi:hypothetical protein
MFQESQSVSQNEKLQELLGYTKKNDLLIASEIRLPAPRWEKVSDEALVPFSGMNSLPIVHGFWLCPGSLLMVLSSPWPHLKKSSQNLNIILDKSEVLCFLFVCLFYFVLFQASGFTDNTIT